jgi:phage FluMu protein Com
MTRHPGQVQCTTCGAILGRNECRAHLRERHPDAEALNARQVAACFTTTLDPMHPGRASKWGYTDAEIGLVILGLVEPIAEEEDSQ